MVYYHHMEQHSEHTKTGVVAKTAHRAVTREIVSSTLAGPTLRVLKQLSRKCCLCNYISKWLCRSKFTSKLALTLFYSDKPISPYKQEHIRCPSQPKTIKTLKTSPLLRVNRSKTNDISSNFAKLDLYGSKKRRENTKAKNTGNPAATG